MGILHELNRHCEDILMRGYKTVSAEYVIDILARYSRESEYTSCTDITDTRMIDKSSSSIEAVTSQNRSQ